MAMKNLLFAASLTILLANPSSAQCCNNHLLSGESLGTSQSLTSRHIVLIMQNDCNLVLYDRRTPIWASGTNGQGSGCYAIMQNDGNFVVYDSNNSPLWASNTNIGNGNYILILQKDRNLVIYSQPIWATETNQVGSVGVIIAPARNGTVGISGANQNKVRKMGRIVEIQSN